MTRWIALNLGRRSLGDLLAEVEHRDDPRELHDQRDILCSISKIVTPRRVDRLDQRVSSSSVFLGIHPGGRLVEQEQAGTAGEGARDLRAGAASP